MAGYLISTPTHEGYVAVVTGANKGIGFEICRQLASRGVRVILTARNEKNGIEAEEKLKGLGFSENQVVFHPLDVVNSASIASLVEFVQTSYGRLDILVNNAGIGCGHVEGDADFLRELIEGDIASVISGLKPKAMKASGKMIETWEEAKICVQTNFYGAKMMTEAFISLLQLSHSPTILNVSSIEGSLQLLPNEWAKGILSNEETLTEAKIDQVIQHFIKSFRQDCLEADGWLTHLAAYKLSKAALNAYTRIMAKQYPSFRINSACPGFVRTDINGNTGQLTATEGADNIVKVALLPHDGGPSGCFFYRNQLMPF